ncbi:hypothetical protein FGG08_006454 [Glutinoglossum americanum]|uniref:Zn(2)-C6 fungal-type domain-containing protein n=1 Tax=Glutinoglossum americanum TaxID=1670608 RepID=A0A9P8HYA0_9PEZI|nr:hypothetical protein FGG08_006454 [Glutinoglossum americanum]
MQPACFFAVHPADSTYSGTPNPFKQQPTQGLAPKKSNANISGIVAEGIMAVLEGLGKKGASVETLTRHPALRNSELDWLQEFAYIYKTDWLDSEESRVPSTVVRVIPKKEPRVEERPVQDSLAQQDSPAQDSPAQDNPAQDSPAQDSPAQDSPMMSPFPDVFDDDVSRASSIQLERKPALFVPRKARKLSAWKARQLGLACHHCRDQHSMCDHIQPSCSGCQEADLHCFYNTTSTKGLRSRLSPSNGNENKLHLDATVSKLKSWILSRSHQTSPMPQSREEAVRKSSLSAHLSGLFASAKRRCSPKSLSAAVGRSRGASDADRRGVGRGILGTSKAAREVPAPTSGVEMGGPSPVRSQAATIVVPPNLQSTSPAVAQSRSSSDRRSSVTRSGSFEETITIALQKAADDAMNAPPDCPSRPFQCTFCLQQCLTKPAWKHHEDSHQHKTETRRHSRRGRVSSSSSMNSTASTGPWNWNCGFCHKTLMTWAERAEHIGEHYDNRLTMSSWDPLTSPSAFDKTSLTYVSENPRWSTVKLLVAQRPELFNHITRTGETEKLFRCRFCDTRYRTWEEFECHHELWHRRHYTWSCPTTDELKRRLLQEQQQRQSATPPSTTNNSPALCPLCSTPTPPPYLLAHLSTAHNFSSCSRHGVRFTTERHFRMHLANKHGFHEGTACGEGFVEACKKVEAALEVERKEVVGRR